MKSLKIIIVDDEKNAVESMQTILKNFCADVEVIGTAYNASTGIEAINRLMPDLVFIDIEMPDANGFDVINCIKNKNIQTVFVTAFEQYAIRAFKANVIGYLLKPIDIDDVQNIIEKARKLIFNRKLIENSAGKNIFNEKICLPIGKGLIFIETNCIIFIEADGSYCRLHLIDQKPIYVSKSLGELEENLDPAFFFRAHHSTLVNLKHVNELNTKDGLCLLMTGNNKVMLSRRKKDDFLKLFKK